MVFHPAAQENIEKPLDWMNYPYPFITPGRPQALSIANAGLRTTSSRQSWLGSWTNDPGPMTIPPVEQIRPHSSPSRHHGGRQQILITLGAQNALYLLATAG